MKEVEKLASFGCIDEEIAIFFDCHVETIRLRKRGSGDFFGAIEKGRAKFCMSLRRKQYQVAMNGNATMLIWLGKNMLDQSDKPAMEGINAREAARQIRKSLQEMKDASGPVTGET